MLFGTCRRARFTLILSVLFLGAETASSETLRQVLAAKNLPIAGVKLENLDKNVTSGAELDDANQFVIAYYLEDATGLLRAPIFLDRYDRSHREWSSAALGDAKTTLGDIEVNCFGSVLSVKAAGSRLFLDTHLSPSAGCLLVLTQNFTLEASLYGWLVGRLGEDKLIYHRSQVHFAPVHPAEIAVYDLRSKRDLTLFPPKPESPIRQARMQQLQTFYKGNEEWCNKNSDPCDPAYFDGALEGEIATNEKGQALAFLVSYEQIRMVEGDVQKPSGPKDVLYVYRRVGEEAKTEYRETLLDDVKARYGDLSLQNLVQPEVLQKIFTEKPDKKP